jgi:tetratricopeptide (TPR) repeat protein
MKTDRLERIKELFEAALERPEQERAMYLADACSGDASLRLEVESLLSGHHHAGDFLRVPAFQQHGALLAQNPPASTFAAGEVVSGRFRVVRFIGRGGMGEVYEARDLELGVRVALKTIRPQVSSNPQMLRRFKQEIQLARRVTHPNVCRIFDLERHVRADGAEVSFLTMEMLEGETLAQRLQRLGRIPASEGLPLIRQMAEGLAAAHKAGVLHCDFKPGNVMLVGERWSAVDSNQTTQPVADAPVGAEAPQETSRTVVTDFGLAQALRRAVPREGVLDSFALGGLVGTPAYMAPEQLQGRPATASSDVYALGLVAYEMFTGRLPFLASAQLAAADQGIDPPSPPLRTLVPDIDRGLESVISRCLETKPCRRYETAREALAAVEACIRPGVQVTHRVHRALAYAAAIAASALIVGLVLIVLKPQTREAVKRGLFPPPIPSRKNLVVIPFKALGGKPEDQAYCDGFTETVTAKLAQETALQVSPTMEVVARHVDSIDRARTQLGASLVIGASWQHLGKLARINLSLMDATTGQLLRSATLTEAADDLFALQDRVVSQALHMLQVRTSENEQKGLTSHGTTVLTAYDFYVQGLGYLQRYEKPENLDTAIGLFRRAVEKDSRFALAHAALARGCWYKFNETRDPTWVEKERAEAKAAAGLDSRSADVQIALGGLYWRTGAYEDAVDAFQRALAVDPDSTEALDGLAANYDALKQPVEAEQAFNRAIAVQSSCWNCYNVLGQFFLRHARYREAVQAWQKMAELTPDNVWGYMNIGAAYFDLGNFASAADYFRRAAQITPDDPDLLSNAGTMSFYAGRFEEDVNFCQRAIKLRPEKYAYWGNLGDAYRMIPAEVDKAPQVYRRAIALAQNELTVNPNDAEVQSDLALYYARVGDPVQALDHLKKALRSLPNDVDVLRIACLVHLEAGETKEALNWLGQSVKAGYPRGQLVANPELAGLRGDPVFQQLVKEASDAN